MGTFQLPECPTPNMTPVKDGRKVQVWEFVFQGLNIGKCNTGNIVMGLLL